MKGRALFRADYRRAIDRVIDYFGDSPAWACRLSDGSVSRNQLREIEDGRALGMLNRADIIEGGAVGMRWRIASRCLASFPGTHASPGALEVACGLSEAKGRS